MGASVTWTPCFDLSLKSNFSPVNYVPSFNFHGYLKVCNYNECFL